MIAALVLSGVFWLLVYAAVSGSLVAVIIGWVAVAVLTIVGVYVSDE